MPMCLGHVKTVRYTDLIRKGILEDTRPCNIAMCRTRLRHTPVSLPMWTKIGHLQSQFATLFSCTPSHQHGIISIHI
ncbi:hypothetical protein F383_09451 [Gossypium arboreum]|uniref:Uncharacterized protein n=1 Tax=Gossypium arboreum TaxID=29729 RepID=A0A0B0NLP8_GOSAR|nr:hypothetical protein F383_09451 [Gossypium arboreum]